MAIIETRETVEKTDIEENIKEKELTFDERVIKCQSNLLEILNNSGLPASVMVLLLEKLMTLAEKGLAINK